MQTTLTPEQEAWLKDRFEVADAASLEAAARRILDERIAEEAVSYTHLTLPTIYSV